MTADLSFFSEVDAYLYDAEDLWVFPLVDSDGGRYRLDYRGRRLYEWVAKAPLWAFPVPFRYWPALGRFKVANRPALGAYRHAVARRQAA